MVHKDDRKKLEQIYRDALKEESINLDAWIGLVNLYITDSTKTEEDLIELATEISEIYTYHPLPMYDLTRRIGTKITSAEYRSSLMMLQEKTLKKATKATSANTIYHKEVPVIANAILGVVDTKVATFSFDGANAGKIVLSKQLQSAQVTWSYSLDGKKTWKESYEHSVQLTQEEIDSIDINNDIKIHITGLPMTDNNIYTIDITKGVFPTSSISINDFEDRMFGTTADMEWTLDPNGEWNSFANTNPIFNGNKKVYVRLHASGTKLASNIATYTFTNNSSEANKRYIPNKLLSVPEVSATQEGNKNNIVDGNFNSYWRSKHGQLGSNYIPAYVIIELAEPRFISALDYTHDKNTSFGGEKYGYARDVDIYVSMDGKEWTLAGHKTFAKGNEAAQQVILDEILQAKYVKFDCKTVHGSGYYNSLSIAEITLYEDTTAEMNPRAEVNYNITQKTNKNVVAELINETRTITVTNNGGKTSHTFTENGSFTFEFVDKAGNKGTATATVDWIDKTPPKAEVQFSTTEPTNENVVATLSFDKNVTILSEDVQIVENPIDKSKTITFLENGSFELKFVDDLGNIGTKTISVDWIDTEHPTAEFEFNTTNLTDSAVVATLKPSEEVTVTNNGGKDTYTFYDNGSFTFEFVDRVGNAGTATASVNWIAKLPQYEIKYSTTKPTNQPVKATLELETGYRIFNNNANNEYTFEENGTFEFQYKDQNGMDGIIPVTVDWIDKEAPTAEFSYSPQTWTNKNVVATLKPSEEVTITNNSNQKTYTFTKNGKFTFEFVDKVGNKGTATATVDWIDREAPIATIEYNIKEPTEGPVVATLKANEPITILGNGRTTYTFYENAEFTFEFVDRAGNKGYATAYVDWIQKKETNKPNNNTGNTTKPNTKPIEKPNQNPNNSNQGSSINSGNTINQGNAVNPNPSENIEETYQNFINENVTVKIPNSILSKYQGANLDYKKLNLSDAQKNRYGEDSEIYELSLKAKDNIEIDLSNEAIEQTIKLNPNKKFDAIYVVRKDGSVVKLESKTSGNNEVVFEDNGLGRYIIAYKSEIPDQEENNSNISKPEEKNEKKTSYLPYIFVGGTILIIGIGYALIRRKNMI